MARQIEAYKLRTELAVDASKGQAAMKSFQKDVDNVGTSFKKLGPQIDASLKGKEAGAKWGSNFGASATAAISTSFDTLGQTLGSVIGTAIEPGIGTAIGATVGSMVDKVGGAITPMIKQGIELNKMLEATRIEFTTFTGSAKAADQYLDNLKKFAHETGTDINRVVETSEKLYDLTGNLELSSKILKAATDQAADFGGSAETITKVADALGLVAEKGELAAKDLKTLFKLGIDAKKYISQATGVDTKTVARMIAAGRVRGDVAARMISEGIERDKGGYAAQLAATSAGGKERRFGVATQLAEIRGTGKITQGLGDYYETADKLISSGTANKLVDALDATAGKLIELTKAGVGFGVSHGGNIISGLVEGMTSGTAQEALTAGVSTMGGWLKTAFNFYFESNSPSELMAREVGVPLGQGVGKGLNDYAQQHAKKDVEVFIQTYQQAAQQAMEETGVPASVTLAQAIIESRVGQSGLTKQGKNFFGIKGRGPAGSVTMPTREVNRAGQSYWVNAPFRAYNTPEESFSDHARFLLGPRYRGALKSAGNPQEYARQIAQAGYATDPKYASTLGSVIEKYGLSKYDTGHPLPVQVVAAPTSGRAVLEAAGYSKSSLDFLYGDGGSKQGKKPAGKAQDLTLHLGEADAAIVNITSSTGELIAVDEKRNTQITSMSQLRLKEIKPLEDLTTAEAEHAATSIAITKEYQEAGKREWLEARSFLTQLAPMIGEVAGMMPTETVGKKRGLFSKILGIAAPFLSFIPGVGPLLSTVAGMASAGVGGNWAGVATAAAGGLAPGGVFRSNRGAPISTKKYVPFMASGGPVYRGQQYIVGEAGAEMFTPSSDGYITPGVGGGSGMYALMARLHATLDRFDSMPADHVVMKGARGLTRAYDQDAGLIREHGRRFNFA